MSSFNFKDLESWFNEKETGKVKQVELRGCSVSVILAVIGVLVLFALVNVARSSYTEWLWFTSLEYGSIFTTVLKTRVLLFFIAAFIFSLVFAGNVVLAARLLPRKELSSWLGAILSKVEKIERLAFIAVTALFAFMFGMVAQAKWDVVLTYFHGQPFGINDPVFNKDVGFYVFTMPFYRFVQNWFLWAMILSLMGTAGIYFL
ncbi:MAG: UPF0182 family protein, partial [Dehalococcoidia bacterium]|nr:UPF0182 family protein [Dehalococcoidia bacterium]